MHLLSSLSLSHEILYIYYTVLVVQNLCNKRKHLFQVRVAKPGLGDIINHRSCSRSVLLYATHNLLQAKYY